MPRFGNFWNANSIQFFYKSHAAWLRGEDANLEDDIRALAQQNALPSGPVNGSIDNHETIVNPFLMTAIDNHETIVNPFLMTAILFGDMNTFSLLRQNLRQQINSDFSLIEKIVICQFAFNFHGNDLFYLQLSRALNWNEINPRYNGENQLSQISRFKEETKYLTQFYISSNFIRLSHLLNSFRRNQDPAIENEIIRTIVEFHDQPEIFKLYGHAVLFRVIELQYTNIFSMLLRVPNLNLDEIPTLLGAVAFRNYLDEVFPAALAAYDNRHALPPLTATDVTPNTATFPDFKIESLLEQFSSLQNVDLQNGEHIIEQIRFIERYASHPELIRALFPKINQHRSTIVLSVALQTAALDNTIRASYQASVRNTWKRGANLYMVNPLTLDREMEPLTASDKNKAAFVLDYYLDSTQPDKLLKITSFLGSLFIVFENPDSDLFHQPHVLDRLVAYADQVNNEVLSSFVNSIPAVRNSRTAQLAQTVTQIRELVLSMSDEQRSHFSNGPTEQQTLAAIANRDLTALNTILSTLNRPTFTAVNSSTTSSVAVVQQSEQAALPPTTEQLSKSLRELIHAAENEPILKFLQTNKAPEIYNNFPMPRHTIFVLLHYLMRHQNVAILSALLNIEGLEHQGIGPYNETIHQFFARYFGPASKTPWPEAITLVTEKIPAITVNSETEIEYKPRTLLQATMLGDVDLVRKCLDALRLIPLAMNFADPHTKETALMIAVKNKDIPIIKELVASKNCQVNLKDRDGNTAYMLAAEQGRRDILDLLREKHKVDITIKNNQNKNAAILANDNGYSELAGDLLQLIQDAEIENKKSEAEDKRRKEYSESLGGYTKRMHDIGMLDKFPKKYIDPISEEIMMKPICLPDGCTFDRSTLEKMSLGKQTKNSLSGQDFPADVLKWKPNTILMEEIEETVLEFEKAHAVKQSQNQDDDNDVDDKVTMRKLG